MHPAMFFENIKILGDENKDIRNLLKEIHPMNFIGTDMVITVIEAAIKHKTNKGNYKVSKKILITSDVFCENEIESIVSFVESRINAYNIMHKKSALKNFKVESAKRLCCGVLRIE